MDREQFMEDIFMAFSITLAVANGKCKKKSCWESSIPLDLFAHTLHTTHYTLHTTHTCLYTLPCPTSGQPTAGTENWKSILYKSGDFSFQVFKNKQKYKMALWLKITYFCRTLINPKVAKTCQKNSLLLAVAVMVAL